MVWVALLALVGWVAWLSARLKETERRLEAVDRRTVAQAMAETVAEAPPPRAPALKTAAAAQPPPRLIRDILDAPPLGDAPSAAPRKPAVRQGPSVRETARAWIEENGLAWAGGGVLALGGLFLVTYAAQRGVFTPPLRIAAAIATGLILLGVSEWLRRAANRDERGHRLAAATAAGAGAATLYGAVWASYWLYAFIGLGAAGALLGVLSLGLLALAFRHGEALAVLAIAGGFLAPAITGPEQWSAPALTAYLAVITVTGYGVMAGRRWGWTGLATLAGAAVWALAGFVAGGYDRVVALAIAPLALAFAALAWRGRRGDEVHLAAVRDPFTLAPTLAFCVGAVLTLALWLLAPPEARALPPLATLFLLVGAAFGLRQGQLPVPTQWAVYLVALGGIAVQGPKGQPDLWLGGVMIAVAICGLVSETVDRARWVRLSTALAAPVVSLMAWVGHQGLPAGMDWAPEALAALLLIGCAAVIARRSDDAAGDLPLAIWIWSAGAAALLALQQAFAIWALPPAAGGLALAGAVLDIRLRWRGFAAVALASAGAALAAVLSTAIWTALTAGDLTWQGYAAVAAASAALCYAGAWLGGRGDVPRPSSDALSTAAMIVALAGVFVLLRFWGTSSAVRGGGLDPFMESGVRTILILVAGLTSALAVRPDSSLIGRWRGQMLLIIGVFHALIFQVGGFNPLWAHWKPAVAGPRISDAILLGFIAPGVLLLVATLRKVSRDKPLLATYAVAGAGLAALGVALETRRLFQGASLHAGLDPIGRAEFGVYALLTLTGAAALDWLARKASERDWTISPLAVEIGAAARSGAWAALGVSILVFGWLASPWWGPMTRPLAGVPATSLLVATYVLGGLGCAWLAGRLAGGDWAQRTARLTVVFIAFALANLLVRLGFRGFDMRPDGQDHGVETWAFSALWGAFGFALLLFGARRRDNDLRTAGIVVLMAALAKVFLFDMDRLDGVVRAASFLAVGALLLAAAVLVRRIAGAGTPPDEPASAPATSGASRRASRAPRGGR